MIYRVKYWTGGNLNLKEAMVNEYYTNPTDAEAKALEILRQGYRTQIIYFYKRS